MTAVNPLMIPLAPQPIDAALHRRGGQRDLRADLGVRRAGVRHEQRNDSLVNGVHLQRFASDEQEFELFRLVAAYLRCYLMSYPERLPRNRTYLMCPPEHFTVEYAINPWMDTTVAGRRRPWRSSSGSCCATRSPTSGTPCTSSTPYPACPTWCTRPTARSRVDGTRLRRPVPAPAARRARPPPTSASTPAGRGRFADPVQVNEGEGDFAYLPGAYGGLILAGYGFRTDPAAHAEAQEVLGRPVVSLKLVDPALLPPGHRAGRARRPARHLLPGGVLGGLPAGPGAAVPGRGDRRPGRRRGVRPQPGQRRPARGAQHRGDGDGATRCGRPATARCRWS